MPLSPAAAPTTAAAPLALPSLFAQLQFSSRTGGGGPRPVWMHVRSLIKRQAAITWRNRLYLALRLASVVVVSAIVGTLWLRIPFSDPGRKWGLLLFVLLLAAFCNMGEIPIAVANKCEW